MAAGTRRGRVLKIGYVTPATGPLAAFSAADDFVLADVRRALAGGINRGGTVHPVEIVAKDSQSNPNRAAEVTSRLIDNDRVDVILAASTADTVNPVADICEANETPCISTDCPWQPYFFGRDGHPQTGFDWTYHFFWGVDALFAVYLDLWEDLPTNRVVGALWPNDAEGNAFADAQHGFPAALRARGFSLVDLGRFQPRTDDFSLQIRAFKAANVQILTGVLAPPSFQTFWTQAAQQDFEPRIATIAKALLFPASVSALGVRGAGLSTEVWWSPSHPYTSGLTHRSAAQLTAEYMRTTGRPWTQPMGFRHALFEVATDVMRRAASVDDPVSIRDAVVVTSLRTIVGPVSWHSGPVRNVATTPLVGGQWRRSARGGMELLVVENRRAAQIPATTTLQALANDP